MVSLLTDFGTYDTSVGQCKGVILSIAPKAVIVDISHGVPHYNIAIGAWMLRQAVPHFPACVHVAVIDPGVGTQRRPIALSCGRGDVLIGPDNGLLIDAAEVLGGITAATHLTEERFRHHPVSRTFHARDIFSPAAAHIVHGVTIHMLGRALDVTTLTRLQKPGTTIREGVLTTSVAYVNEYGSLALHASAAHLAELGTVRRVAVTVAGSSFAAQFVTTFGDAEPGTRVILVDSYGQLCLATNQGSLAGELGLGVQDLAPVTLRATE